MREMKWEKKMKEKMGKGKTTGVEKGENNEMEQTEKKGKW